MQQHPPQIIETRHGFNVLLLSRHACLLHGTTEEGVNTTTKHEPESLEMPWISSALVTAAPPCSLMAMSRACFSSSCAVSAHIRAAARGATKGLSSSMGVYMCAWKETERERHMWRGRGRGFPFQTSRSHAARAGHGLAWGSHAPMVFRFCHKQNFSSSFRARIAASA